MTYTSSEYWGAGYDHANDFRNSQGKPIIPDTGTTVHLFLQLYPQFYSDSGVPHTQRQFKQALASFRRGLKAGVKASRKKNPGGRMTKLQKKVKAQKAATKRRVATALAKYLKQANPGRNVIGAAIHTLKGGAKKIVPIFGKTRRSR